MSIMKMTIKDLQNVDGKYLTMDEMEQLRNNANVSKIECFGYSGVHPGALWYDVKLQNESRINVYI